MPTRPRPTCGPPSGGGDGASTSVVRKPGKIGRLHDRSQTQPRAVPPPRARPPGRGVQPQAQPGDGEAGGPNPGGQPDGDRDRPAHGHGERGAGERGAGPHPEVVAHAHQLQAGRRPDGPPGAAAPARAAVSLPKLGTYVYDLSGTTQSPLLGLPQSYPSGATLSTNFSAATPRAGGTEVVSRGTSSQDQAQTTTKWLFQPSKVLLTFSNLTFLGLASYDCTYAPAPEILPIPLPATTLPTQSWSGAQCTGSLQLTVTGLETVSAAGQAWNVWRVHTAVHYVAQSSVDATLDTTSLFSPELGTVVTSDSATTGKVAGSPFTSHQVTSLKSHP